jgi:hypothetical protein
VSEGFVRSSQDRPAQANPTTQREVPHKKGKEAEGGRERALGEQQRALAVGHDHRGRDGQPCARQGRGRRPATAPRHFWQEPRLISTRRNTEKGRDISRKMPRLNHPDQGTGLAPRRQGYDCQPAAEAEPDQTAHAQGSGLIDRGQICQKRETIELPPGKELDHAGPGGGSLCVSSDDNRKGSTSTASMCRGMIAVYRG